MEEATELLALQVEQAKNEVNETYFQIGIAQSSIEQAKENLKVVNDNYKGGIVSMSDLLEAQALYQDALNQHINSKFQKSDDIDIFITVEMIYEGKCHKKTLY